MLSSYFEDKFVVTAQLSEFQKTLQMKLCEMEMAENTLETKHPHIPKTEKASKKKVTDCTNCWFSYTIA